MLKIKEGLNRWTKKEEKLLKDNFNKLNVKQLSLLTGRGERAVGLKLQNLKLFRAPSWEDSETIILIKNYGKTKISNIMELLPNKSYRQICKKAKKLNLCREKPEYLGKKFGRLAVLEQCKNTDSYTRWRCKCDCGKEVILNGSSLTRRTEPTRSCGCLNTEKTKLRRGNKSSTWRGCGDISKTMYWRIIENARRRRLEFSVDIDYLDNLFKLQKSKCSISGLDLQVSFVNLESEITASLDRIDSSKGYIKGNVQWVHKDINRMKWEFSENKFFSLCKLITEYQQI